MIYTIGNRQNYLEAIERSGRIFKAEGGYAFQSIADAERRIVECDKVGEWAVWGLHADWSDTRPAADGWWHELIVDALICTISAIVI